MSGISGAMQSVSQATKGQKGVKQADVKDLQKTVRQVTSQDGAEGGKGTETVEGLKNAASRFEAIFLRKMLDQGRSDAIKSDLFKDSTGLKKFRKLLDARFARKSASVDGGVGVGEMVFEEFKETVESTQSDSQNNKPKSSVDITS